MKMLLPVLWFSVDFYAVWVNLENMCYIDDFLTNSWTDNPSLFGLNMARAGDFEKEARPRHTWNKEGPPSFGTMLKWDVGVRSSREARIHDALEQCQNPKRPRGPVLSRYCILLKSQALLQG